MGNADNRPLISVIVPVYNVENYLRACVDSIIAQTYDNLEIILVDDGSPDNCPAICDEYAEKDRRIKVIHKKNGGVSSARNVALGIITGNYVSFIDSDDYISSDYFEKMINFEADVVVTESNNVYGLHLVDEIKCNYYIWGGFIGPCQKLYNREKIRDIRFREDIIYNLEVLNRIESVFYIPFKGYYVNDNPLSLTRKKSKTYDMRLDEEYQKKWGKIHSEALLSAGISQETTSEKNREGCSVWIYQKIKNYCYHDCPHSFRERKIRIKRQLDNHRNDILTVKNPTSPNTHLIVKICTLSRSAFVTYMIFKILIMMGK